MPTPTEKHDWRQTAISKIIVVGARRGITEHHENHWHGYKNAFILQTYEWKKSKNSLWFLHSTATFLWSQFPDALKK